MRRLLPVVLLLAGVSCDRGLSPGDSIDALMDAVIAKDSLEIARLADLSRVAESAVDPLIQAAGTLSELDPDGFGQQAGGMGVQMLQQFRPMIAPLMEQLFWQMLLDPESTQRGPLAQVMAGRTVRFDQIAEAYRGVAEEREDGPDARVLALDIAPDNFDVESFTVEVRLERAEGYWRVVSFLDLGPTVTTLMERGS